MNVEPFALERWQSLWENRVDYCLTESGVHPCTLAELFTPGQIRTLLDLRLTYGQTNGSPELRRRIASLYPGADEDAILVTNGSAEANFVLAWSLLEAGDEIVYMVPNYFQIRGLARSLGVRIRNLELREELRWQPDLDRLESLVNPKTRAIVLCHPNNPTGARLSGEAIAGLLSLARARGLWIWVDEIYRGAELDGEDSEALWGRHERVVVSAGLSKACALPGLRIGWLAGPGDCIAEAWARTDYTSIAPGVLSDRAACMLFESGLRERIFERNRSILNTNLAVLEAWIRDRGNLLALVPPEAGGMAFVRYAFDVNSSELAERLRREKSVLVVPGDCYGMDGYLRIGIGAEPDYFKAGLARIGELFTELARDAA